MIFERELATGLGRKMLWRVSQHSALRQQMRSWKDSVWPEVNMELRNGGSIPSLRWGIESETMRTHSGPTAKQ